MKMTGLQFEHRAAAGYDQAVGIMTRQLIPTLLKAVRLAPGDRALDVAAGTGLAAEAAAVIVGPSGHVTAADISPAMVEKARERLVAVPNIAFAVEDAQALTFPDASFDAVICNMGLMYFSDPAQGLVEMRRVLRPGGSLSVSVNTSPATALLSRLLILIDRHVPAGHERKGPAFFDGSERNLLHLFRAAGFKHVETSTETRHLPFPSFDAYFGGVEQGAGNVGQEYLALPADIRQAVREDARRLVGDAGGPIEVEVTTSFASGRR
jgi:ubiquinone/menaquinone biosynthesis C-methylase UbiE